MPQNYRIFQRQCKLVWQWLSKWCKRTQRQLSKWDKWWAEWWEVQIQAANRQYYIYLFLTHPELQVNNTQTAVDVNKRTRLIIIVCFLAVALLIRINMWFKINKIKVYWWTILKLWPDSDLKIVFSVVDLTRYISLVLSRQVFANILQFRVSNLLQLLSISPKQ